MSTNRAVILSAIAVATLGSAAMADLIPVGSYSYLTSPSGAYPDSGGELTDGVWPTDGILPSEGWVGFDDGNPASMIFDLGSAQVVDSATIYFCQWGNAAVYLPTSVTFEFSNDPTFTFGIFGRGFQTALEDVHGGITARRDYNFLALGALPALRYVRVTADHDRQWLFMGEVQFFQVPAPASAALLGLAALAAGRRRR
jgi:hypothetical protein